MTPLLTPLVARDTLVEAGPRGGLACEAQLQVAAGMLAHASRYEIGSTRVVGVLGADDAAAFNRLVGEVADTFALEAQVRLRPGSFSVRFQRAPVRGES